MSGLQELPGAAELATFISSNAIAVVTYSAHWCGPCKASKPQLEQMASTYGAKSPPIPFAIVYEDALGEDMHAYHVRAFPTYAVYGNGKELGRVEGVNFTGLQQEIAKASAAVSAIPATGGNTLGGGNASKEDARAARLARLAAAPAASDDVTPMDTTAAATTTTEPAAEAAAAAATTDSKPAGKKEAEKPDEAKEAATASEDATMTDAAETTESPTAALDALDQEAIKTLTGEMGFTLLRAQKGLLFGNGPTVEAAVEWLMEHQEDIDIDQPIPDDVAAGKKAQSYKCNECGKILSNLANLELHANKTGHSDFEESTERIKPLTPEEKIAKIAQIKELLVAKRAQREEAEKVDNVEREKQRRFMGKEMAKTREEMEREQRKREAKARKREKDAYKRERERIRAELEKDKRERMANKGKLSSKLGVDGYNPDAIQYDKDAEEGDGSAAVVNQKKRKSTASSAKIDEYIAKVSAYRAGGDGGKCLKILKAYISNVVDKPTEVKFQTINMENKAFRTKVKPFLGAKHLLLAVGFNPKEGDSTQLVLSDDADRQLLADTKAKLEKAFAAF